MENGPFIDDKYKDLPVKNGYVPVPYVKYPQGKSTAYRAPTTPPAWLPPCRRIQMIDVNAPLKMIILEIPLP
jgi:hypothetical protein